MSPWVLYMGPLWASSHNMVLKPVMGGNPYWPNWILHLRFMGPIWVGPDNPFGYIWDLICRKQYFIHMYDKQLLLRTIAPEFFLSCFFPSQQCWDSFTFNSTFIFINITWDNRCELPKKKAVVLVPLSNPVLLQFCHLLFLVLFSKSTMLGSTRGIRLTHHR